MHFTNVNPSKLQDELLNAGVEMTENMSSDLDLSEDSHLAGNAWCEFVDGTDMDLVQSIVDAHDVSPVPLTPTKEEVIEQQIIANTDYLLDVDFRLMLLELGLI